MVKTATYTAYLWRDVSQFVSAVVACAVVLIIVVALVDRMRGVK